MTMGGIANQDRPNLTRRCECGQPKNRGAHACPRCLFLDGSHRIETIVIEYMRGSNHPATMRELAEAAYTAVGASWRSVHRTMQYLLKRKRVVKIQMDVTYDGGMFGWGIRQHGHTVGGYRLCG